MNTIDQITKAMFPWLVLLIQIRLYRHLRSDRTHVHASPNSNLQEVIDSCPKNGNVVMATGEYSLKESLRLQPSVKLLGS